MVVTFAILSTAENKHLYTEPLVAALGTVLLWMSFLLSFLTFSALWRYSPSDSFQTCAQTFSASPARPAAHMVFVLPDSSEGGKPQAVHCVWLPASSHPRPPSWRPRLTPVVPAVFICAHILEVKQMCIYVFLLPFRLASS